MPITRIGIVYDTSYLMNGFTVVPRSTRVADLVGGNPTDEEFKEFIRLVQYVPVEVQQEILTHLSVKGERHTVRQKGHAARKARGLLAELRDDPKAIYRFREPKLEALVDPHSCITILGADSHVDRLVIAYALLLVEAKKHKAAFVATSDGGVVTEIVELRKRTGLPIQ
jgi:hypothetical protein